MIQLSGKLKMSDYLSGNYIIENQIDVDTDDSNEIIIEDVNIINILNSIYFSSDDNYCPVVNVEVEMNGRYKFKEEGYLEIKKEIGTGIYCFHINGENLDLKLHKNIGKELNINITHITDEERKN